MKSLEKLGSDKHPIRISVWDEENLAAVAKVCDRHNWKFVAKIDPDEDEDLMDFIAKIQYEKAKAAIVSAPETINPQLKPNFFCPCDSGKKYKKCCMPSATTVTA